MRTLFLVSMLLATQHAYAQGGFAEQQVATQLDSPVGMTIAPDGRVFIAQQGGDLRVVENDVLLATPFVSVPTIADDEEGLLGVAIDPNFAANSYVYVFYTASSPTRHNRLVRYTANGNVAQAGSAVVLYDMDDLGAHYHVGGALHFGADGNLYFTTGDNADGNSAQNLSSTHGKLLRIAADGSIPTDNPFYGTLAGKHRAIWAYGFRNAFTFDVQPTTGRIFVNDVGGANWEEVDDAVAGGNYGWPIVEGPGGAPTYRDPLHSYDHNAGCAITGGAFYNPATAQFPAQYVGKYFYTEYCQNEIRTIDPASPASYTGFRSTIAAGPVDLRVGPDGSLYYLSRGNSNSSGGTGMPTGVLVWLTYTGGNAPAISVDPQSQLVTVGDTATFSVIASGAAPLTYQWQKNGGDVAGASAASYTTPATTLADDGALFRCVVTNGFGSSASNAATLGVTANQPPTASITAPLVGAHYSAGSVLAFAGSGDDPETGPLGAGAFTWQIDLHHNVHSHPALLATSGSASGSYSIPADVETATDVFYRVSLSVRDAAGLTTTVTRDVLPNLGAFDVQTSPAGLQIRLDGTPQTAPQSVSGVVGVTRTLGVVSPQVVGGTVYTFGSWSDGGTATHAISTPVGPTTYTATYIPAVPLAIQSVDCQLRFDKLGRDRGVLKGVLPGLPAAYVPTGKLLVVDIGGGAQASFTLDARGRGTAHAGSVELTLPKNFAGGAVAFRVDLKSGSWTSGFLDDGVDPTESVANLPLTLAIVVTLDGTPYAANTSVHYTGTAHKRGRLRVP